MSDIDHENSPAGDRPGKPVFGNWGRWGNEDQRGAANFAGPDVVKNAAALVRQGRVISLGIDIKADAVPMSEGRPTPVHAMLFDGGDYAAGVRLSGGFQFADDYLALGCHSGTHVDALAHAWYDDLLYNGHSAARVRSYGATRCGIEQLGQLATRGVLVDVAKAKGVPHLEGGYAITPEDIDAALAHGGATVREGDCVLVRTGWWTLFSTDRSEYDRAAPGVNDAAARHLAELRVSAVGSDTIAFEVVPQHGTFEGGSRTPVAHRALIRDYGIYILELLDLEELSQTGVSEFLFVAAPLRIVGGTASPLNPLAIV
jgi:kynurenine formamidase